MQENKPETIDRRLAEALRSLRERAGMSQSALAAAMAERGHLWHQQTVGRAEAGQQQIRFAEAVALARIFGVALERFTWASGDANAIDWLDMHADRLRGCFSDTARAVAAQISAGELAKRSIGTVAGRTAPRVLEALELLEHAIEEYGPLQNAFDEGVRMYEEMHEHGGDEEDDDGGDAESEPGLVDQREA